ncbi:hypothetical protein H7F36_17125 [Variovorax sp. PAMC28562]|nr:hypothetical protein [Variovorax sp. PAMC28562]QNK76004.1 hypothetical protein H7F36_17125 [Variovorax sp. PAMC28562]
MAQAVKISDLEMDALRDAARVNSRSISGQAEHWIRIGRAIERDPTIGYSKVDLALRGLEPLALDTLGDAEQDAFIERMGDAPATAVEQDFWRKRQRKGLGVGLDDDGNLEFGKAVRPTGGQ